MWVSTGPQTVKTITNIPPQMLHLSLEANRYMYGNSEYSL